MERDNQIVGSNSKNLFRIVDIASIIFLAISLSLSAYVIILLFHSPLEQLRVASYLILLISLAIAIFFSIGLLRHFTNFTGKSWIFYILQFLVALVLPLVLIGAVEGAVQKKILAVVKNDMTHIVTYINNYKVQEGNFPKGIDRAISNSYSLNNITYYSNTDTYMLETSVPSIDIDGAKIFYDSRDRQWYEFHNDEYQYYQDKKEKPKSVANYISLIKQMKIVESYTVKADGIWNDSKYVTKKIE